MRQIAIWISVLLAVDAGEHSAVDKNSSRNAVPNCTQMQFGNRLNSHCISAAHFTQLQIFIEKKGGGARWGGREAGLFSTGIAHKIMFKKISAKDQCDREYDEIQYIRS